MSRAGRDELRAEALGEVLVVRRWHAGQERALLMSFGTEDTELSSLAAGLGLANVQVLLSSSTGRPRAKLPGGAAVILSIDHHSSKPGK
jgi:hypothetical protein